MFNFDNLMKSSIYDELKEIKNHSQATQDCVHENYQALFEEFSVDEHTQLVKPVCLLGKIQSGKTTAFIGTIAKAFDENIKTVIVLTKNSSILGKQTTKRLINELHATQSGGNIDIRYIKDVNVEEALSDAQLHRKRVIVGIKHYKNIQRIFKFIVQNNTSLANQPILIVDDEADVSSVGYRSTSENIPFSQLSENDQNQFIEDHLGEDLPTSIKKKQKELLLVAEAMNLLRINLTDHRYLQVTATPASIFLQPESIEISSYDPNYFVNTNIKAPLLSDKTVLLPIHDQYVGGEFFFGQSDQPDSMANFAHRAVDQNELDCLSKRDQRHINHIFKSNNFPCVTELVDNLLLCTASHIAAIIWQKPRYKESLRSCPQQLLSALFDRLKGFSAMMHTSTQIKMHHYHYELIDSYIRQCRSMYENNIENLRPVLKDRLKKYFDTSILESYKLFKHHSSFPSSYLNNLDDIDFDFIFECYGEILIAEHIRVYEINSDNQVASLINESTGELKKDVLANIYVGGQSLDRGITIDRLVGFFYGRSPKIAQLDTTLQHARIYGARLPEDLVFTRLYMSNQVHGRLIEITEIDTVLRDSIAHNNGDNRFAAIELGKTGVRPTSPSRLMMSDCINLKTHKTFLPVGFQTRKGNACELHMQKIDDLIRTCIAQSNQCIPNLPTQEEGVFIHWEDFEKIFNSFMDGMIPKDRWLDHAKGQQWVLEELSAFKKIIKNAYFQDNNRIILLVKRNRQMNRFRLDGRLNDAPQTASSDSKQLKCLMELHGNIPGVLLLEQVGKEDLHTSTRNGTEKTVNQGWCNQRFYWPLLMFPTLPRPIMVNLASLRK
jgi:hypothetical protein